MVYHLTNQPVLVGISLQYWVFNWSCLTNQPVVIHTYTLFKHAFNQPTTQANQPRRVSSSATRRCVAGARPQLGEPSPATPGAKVGGVAPVAGWNMLEPCTLLAVGCWMLDVECWMLGLGGVGCWLLLLLLNSLSSSLWSFSLSILLSAAGCWIERICRRSKSGCWQSEGMNKPIIQSYPYSGCSIGVPSMSFHSSFYIFYLDICCTLLNYTYK